MALPALPRRRQEAPARPRCGGAEAPGSRSPRPGPAPPPPPPPPPPPAASAGPRGAAAPGGRRAGQGSPTRELGSRARGGGLSSGCGTPGGVGGGGARPGPRPRPHRASGRPRGVRTPHRARAARPCRCPGTARALLRGGGHTPSDTPHPNGFIPEKPPLGTAGGFRGAGWPQGHLQPCPALPRLRAKAAAGATSGRSLAEAPLPNRAGPHRQEKPVAAPAHLARTGMASEQASPVHTEEGRGNRHGRGGQNNHVSPLPPCSPFRKRFITHLG